MSVNSQFYDLSCSSINTYPDYNYDIDVDCSTSYSTTYISPGTCNVVGPWSPYSPTSVTTTCRSISPAISFDVTSISRKGCLSLPPPQDIPSATTMVSSSHRVHNSLSFAPQNSYLSTLLPHRPPFNFNSSLVSRVHDGELCNDPCSPVDLGSTFETDPGISLFNYNHVYPPSTPSVLCFPTGLQGKLSSGFNRAIQPHSNLPVASKWSVNTYFDEDPVEASSEPASDPVLVHLARHGLLQTYDHNVHHDQNIGDDCEGNVFSMASSLWKNNAASPYQSPPSSINSPALSLTTPAMYNTSRRIGPSSKPPKVFVSYLPPIYTVDDVARLFSPYGLIVSIKLLPTPNESLLPLKYRCGFVQFDRESAVNACIQALHQFHLTLDGKRYILTVRNASDQAPVNNTNLMVKGLPVEMSEKELFDTFAQFGRVTSVRIIRDRYLSSVAAPSITSTSSSKKSPDSFTADVATPSRRANCSKGLAFVNYAIPGDALKSIQNLHNAFINGRRIHVSFAEKEYPYNVHVFDHDPGPEVAAMQSGTSVKSRIAPFIPASPCLDDSSVCTEASHYPTPTSETLRQSVSSVNVVLDHDRIETHITQNKAHCEVGSAEYLIDNEESPVWQHFASPNLSPNISHQKCFDPFRRLGKLPFGHLTGDYTASANDAPNNATTVIMVTNIPAFVDEADVALKFSQFGQICQMHLLRVLEDNTSPQTAVIAYTQPAAAMRAIHADTEMHGSPLIVSYAQEKCTNTAKSVEDASTLSGINSGCSTTCCTLSALSAHTTHLPASPSFRVPTLSPLLNPISQRVYNGSIGNTSSVSPITLSSLNSIMEAPEFYPNASVSCGTSSVTCSSRLSPARSIFSSVDSSSFQPTSRSPSKQTSVDSSIHSLLDSSPSPICSIANASMFIAQPSAVSPIVLPSNPVSISKPEEANIGHTKIAPTNNTTLLGAAGVISRPRSHSSSSCSAIRWGSTTANNIGSGEFILSAAKAAMAAPDQKSTLDLSGLISSDRAPVSDCMQSKQHISNLVKSNANPHATNSKDNGAVVDNNRDDGANLLPSDLVSDAHDLKSA